MNIKKNTPIIIIGFGSIGERHYNNLKKIGYNNLYIYDPDKNLARNGKLKFTDDISMATLKKFDIAIICTPTDSHIKIALRCVKAGCHLFIEKPLSHNLRSLEALQKACREKNIVSMIGCQMRFHPCLRFIKEYLSAKRLGRVYSIIHEFGFYLPFWRPNKDYKKNYAAKKNTGGGIILDDIHEFDLLFWLNNFEKVIESRFVFNKVSELSIETEDNCIASFKFKNKVLGLVRCDYLQKDYTRKCKIVGENGNIEWDFKDNIVWLRNERVSKKLYQLKNFNFNANFISELKYFFDCIEKKQKTFNDIATAGKVLEHCVKRR